MAKLSSAIAVALALGTPAAALADAFEFETGLSFLRSEQSGVIRSTVIPLPPIFTPGFPAFTTRTNVEEDEATFSGTWFVSGVNINEGPRSRAAFLSRASSVTLEYADVDASIRGRVTFDDPNSPDQTFGDSFDGSSFSIGGRYVAQSSGWYGFGSIASRSIDNRDVENYRLGIGKYVGERTTVDSSVSYDDVAGFSQTTFALSLSHVGDLSARWQYGADVSISRSDLSGADSLLGAAFSLYPSRSVAFGLQYSGSLENLDGFARYDAFASWFISESVELSARYGTSDQDDSPFVSSDDDRWGLGVRVRF